MSSRSRSWLGLAVVLAIVALLAIPKLPSFFRNDSEAAEAEAEPAGSDVLTVSAERVEPMYLAERLATTGTLRAAEQVEVVSEVAGKVASLHFREGSPVERGRVLVTIDASELEASRERARFRLELASRREEQQRKLFEEGIISREEYDRQLSEKNVLEAESRLLEVQIAKTRIRAPFSGVVGLRRVSEGSYLSPQTPVTTLQKLDPIKLDFSVPEQYASLVEPGREIRFRVKSSEEPFTGRVYAVEPVVDPATRSLTVRAESSNPGRRLVPGAFADVELTVREAPEALAVPAIAVIPELGGRKVFVLKGNAAEPRQVTTGIRTDEFLEITSGLEAGEVVITSGLLQLKAGMEVDARVGAAPGGAADAAAAPGVESAE